jgi:hypothetical protein
MTNFNSYQTPVSLTFVTDILEALLLNEELDEFNTQRFKTSQNIRVALWIFDVVLLLDQLKFLTQG